MISTQFHMQKLGFQGTLEDVVAIWKRNALNWQDRRIPWRPSPGDIALYKGMIEGERTNTILMLGATPELRDLIASMNNLVTLVDICPEMIQSTGQLLKVSRPENETHVIADWCTLPFSDASFDLIVGDCLWWLFSTSNQELLRDELARVLKPDGVIVSRSHFCNASLVGTDLEKMTKEHLLLLTDTGENRAATRELLMSHLLDATTDTVAQRFDTAKAITVIDKIISEDTNHERHRSFLQECVAALRGRVDWSSQTREQVLGFLEERFALENEISAKDYADSRFFPILKLKKRALD